MKDCRYSQLPAYKNLSLCLELIKWRNDEIKHGSMDKAKKIQDIIKKYSP
jgi:hypothetical protein